MQTSFTRWAREQGQAFARAHGVPGFAFELKHVTCKGRGLNGSGRVRCEPSRCASRLSVGEHEQMQADALTRVAFGGTKAPSGALIKPMAYKISDMSAGYKPFDGFFMGAGCGAFAFVGFSCPASREARVYALGSTQWAEMVEGSASVTEDDCRRLGEAVEIPR